MKGSLIVITFFIAGIVAGYFDIIPRLTEMAGYSIYVLYLLIAIIGFEFGYKNLIPTIKKLDLTSFLLPLFTIGGTLIFTALAWLLLHSYPLHDYLAIGSAAGYYSLSSVLIMEYKKASAGLGIAAELGTIALLSNMTREIISLTCAPVFRKYFGWYAPIASAGVASIDVVLPVIVRNCGPGAVPVAIVQGVILEILVPVTIMLFCSL